MKFVDNSQEIGYINGGKKMNTAEAIASEQALTGINLSQGLPESIRVV